MSDLISREAAINTVFSMCCRWDTDDSNDLKDLLLTAFQELPTIEAEPYIEFCEWVAEEIFGDEGNYWENVKDAFPELACRRLHKLGIVHKEGDKWLWVDRKELEE